MSTWQDLSVVQNNDITFSFSLTLDGAYFPLAGYTVDVVVKASQSATDGSGTTFTPTVTNAALGKVSWSLLHQYTATPGTEWYRLDAIDASNNRTTFFMGNLTVQAA